MDEFWHFPKVMFPCLCHWEQLSQGELDTEEGEFVGKAVSEAQPQWIGPWFSVSFPCPSTISYALVILASNRSPGNQYWLTVLIR